MIPLPRHGELDERFVFDHLFNECEGEFGKRWWTK
jgi:hypothetical protein